MKNFKRKMLLVFFTFILAVCAAFAFSACKGSTYEHDYVIKFNENYHWLECVKSYCDERIILMNAHFDENDDGKCDYCSCKVENVHKHAMELIPETLPTCTAEGEKAYYKCSACGKLFFDKDGKKVITDKTKLVSPKSHNFENKVCIFCGKPQPSDGLEYTLSSDGTYYICSGAGTATDADIIIADLYNGKKVSSIGENAFYGCSSRNSVIIPDSVTSIGDYAFYNCSNLTSIVIPDSITSIGDSAFSHCSGLTSITIPDSVTSIGNSALISCSSLANITVGENNANYASQEGILYNKAKTNILFVPKAITNKVTIPDSVTSIGNYTFSDCSLLTSITIPDSVTSIGDYAFDGCSSLTSITIPDSVTSIGYYAFHDCSSLTSISIPDSVTSISAWTFYYCNGLKSITIPDSVTFIGESAFEGCSSLTNIIIPDSVTSIDKYVCEGV